MFAILVPAALSPLILTLVWAERKAKKLELVKNTESQPVFRQIVDAANKLDLFGLILLGTSVTLILLPLTLSQTAKGHWKNRKFVFLSTVIHLKV